MLVPFALWSWLALPRAHAHPSAASAPEFPSAECITTLDKSRLDAFTLSYVVPADDMTLTEGDIPLPDAKTHQFFAFRGQVAALGPSYVYRAFDGERAAAIQLPLWITHADVQRAAAASAAPPGPTDLPADEVLETQATLADQWLRMTPDAARLPILARQSKLPVRWPLADVPVGVYSVVGYIFSPPFNGWGIRPGVLKIRDAEHDPPAGQIAPISDTVFSYQGRRVSTCLDVPEGTRLDGYYQSVDQPDQGWQSWLSDRPVESGELSLCFHTPRRELSGNVRLRLALRAPDGTRSVLHSSDTFTWLQGQGRCEPSSTQCCDFDDAPMLSGIEAGTLALAAQPTAAGTPALEASSPAPERSTMAGGCSVLRPRQGRAGLALFLLALVALRRQRSTGAPS